MEEVIPWTLANDHQKFARYLVPFLDDLRGLSVTMPKVYRVFNKDGQFSVQMIKDVGMKLTRQWNTIKRDCKTTGGYVGFSANFATTQR